MTVEFFNILSQSFSEKFPESVSALAAVISTFGVWFVWSQLSLQKSIAQLQFEDGLEREYRELVARIPTKALLDSDLAEDEYRETLDEFFRYFDLSNRQMALRKDGRIGDATWANWRSGIRFNMSLPAFNRAWGEISSRTAEHADEFFSELRRLHAERYETDPKRWK